MEAPGANPYINDTRPRPASAASLPLIRNDDSPRAPVSCVDFRCRNPRIGSGTTKIPRKNPTFATRCKIDSPVKPSTQKYFASVFRKFVIVCRRPVLMKRGGRVVTNVERGMRWTRCIVGRTMSSRTAKSCGPGLPTLRPSSQALTSTRATGARKPGPRGEHEGHR